MMSSKFTLQKIANAIRGPFPPRLNDSRQDTFRLPPPSARLQQPIFVSGGVSPVFENNPTFRVWKHRGGELLDFTVHRARLNHSGPQERRLRFARSSGCDSLEIWDGACKHHCGGFAFTRGAAVARTSKVPRARIGGSALG